MSGPAELVFDGAAGPRQLWSYGRAVWDRVREEAVSWRRRPQGPAFMRTNGSPEAFWWAMLDGPFEASGGVVDLLFRANVLSAFLDDVPSDIEALGRGDDPWLQVLRVLCQSRNRNLRVVADARIHRIGPKRVGARARLLGRRAIGTALSRTSRADLLLVVTHGHMSQRAEDGRVVDRYTIALAPALRTAMSTQVISLEQPASGISTDVGEILRGSYVPWTCFVSMPELLKYGAERERWIHALTGSDALSLTNGTTDLTGIFAQRATPLAARGMALARLYEYAFARIADRVNPRVVVAVEGHSNVGRMIGLAMPGVPLLAPQGGIIGPGGETNGAYDQRFRTPLSVDGARGWPVPARSLLWGAYYARMAERLGHPPERIAIVGLPRELPRLERDPRYVLYVAGANDDLFAFAYSLEEELLTIAAVRECLDRSIPMIVRLHPNHDVSRYRRLLPTGIELSIGRERPLALDLERARLVVGKASTALVEAAAVGVPVLCVNFGPTPDIWGMSASGLAYVEDRSELADALREVDSMAPSPIVEDLVACSGLPAISRVVDEVKRVAV